MLGVQITFHLELFVVAVPDVVAVELDVAVEPDVGACCAVCVYCMGGRHG
mgnify:CR=1 FL=1